MQGLRWPRGMHGIAGLAYACDLTGEQVKGGREAEMEAKEQKGRASDREAAVDRGWETREREREEQEGDSRTGTQSPDGAAAPQEPQACVAGP